MCSVHFNDNNAGRAQGGGGLSHTTGAGVHWHNCCGTNLTRCSMKTERLLPLVTLFVILKCFKKLACFIVRKKVC